MANKTFQIKIESILGGQSPTSHFASDDQFRASLGIDPGLAIDANAVGPYSTIGSGLLRPTGYFKKSSTTITDIPLWLRPNPKDTNTYVYSANGSVYTFSSGGTVSGLGDLNDGGTSSGNGMEYYDNYIYLGKDTTVARYGPLDGTPTFTDDYWVGTLGKTALVDTDYPRISTGFTVPNRFLHRHSDGKLYIADVVGNQGTIHYIKTTKTTVEGDTDDGSTYDALNFGYGLYPTAMETYGEYLVVALYEGGSSTSSQHRGHAQIAFWDTVSDRANIIIFKEFADNLITGLKNINGVLYVVSGNTVSRGFRISRYLGGYTFEEVHYSELGVPPLPGAVDGLANRIFFGSNTYVNTLGTQNFAGVVYSLGLQKSALGDGLFIPIKSSETNSIVTAVTVDPNAQNVDYATMIGWSTGSSGGSNNGIDVSPTLYLGGGFGTNHAMWWSQTYRIGQPFKITKIRIPLAQAVASNMSITPTIYVDDGVGSYVGGAVGGLNVINNTNYPSKRNIVFRPENLTGEHNFWLGLDWNGSVLCTVGLPITIEYELIDD